MKIVLPEDRPRVEVPINGVLVVLSPVIKSDRRFFEAGLDLLSIESRYTRFGQGISHLSDRELDYLTDVDQRQHVAWGAAVGGDIAAVGRYIASVEGCPEVAITVLDEFQARGVGPLLFTALAAVARNDDIDELCFEAMDGNEAVRKILTTYELSPISFEGNMRRRLRLSDVPTTRYDGEFVAAIDEVRAKR